MEKFYFKDFYVNGKKYTFVKSNRTPLKDYKECVDLCGCGSGTNLTIPFSEMEKAIETLQNTGVYDNFSVSEHEKHIEELETKRRIEFNSIMEKSREEQIKKEARIKNVITQLKEYCSKNDGMQLVYNKLEECIEEGYFIVYTYRGHRSIKLEDVGITL